MARVRERIVKRRGNWRGLESRWRGKWTMGEKIAGSGRKCRIKTAFIR